MIENFGGLKIAILFLFFILILKLILKGWQKVAVQSPLPLGERAGVRGYIS